MGIWNRYRYVT